MSAQPQPPNLDVYNRPDVAAHYGALDYLDDCERRLFEDYLKLGMAILDLGVGGGRTTPCLSMIASRYVGVDYAEEMIGVCRSKFPQLEFAVGDASDLSRFADASFDAVIFTFNGLDCLAPDLKRQQCLRECHRVLKNDGLAYVEAYPIWTGPRGHHVHEDMVQTWCPGMSYQNDGTIIPEATIVTSSLSTPPSVNSSTAPVSRCSSSPHPSDAC